MTSSNCRGRHYRRPRRLVTSAIAAWCLVIAAQAQIATRSPSAGAGDPVLTANASAPGPGSNTGETINFKVFANQATYSAGFKISLTFIVENTGNEPVHILRSTSNCSSPLGAVYLHVIDETGNRVPTTTCHVGIGPVSSSEMLQQVSSERAWLQLNPGEVWGRKIQVKFIGNKRGVFRIRAELTPPAVEKELRKSLAENNIKILERPHFSPTITINIE